MVIKMAKQTETTNEEIVSSAVEQEEVMSQSDIEITLPVYLDDPRYFFWLTSDYRIYATLIAMTEDDIKLANEQNMVEVESSVFFKANANLVYKDGKLSEFQPEIVEAEKRYYIEVDNENYITACHVAIGQPAIDHAISLNITEITEDQYISIGQDSQYIDGKIVKGPPKTVVLSPEALKAIVESLTKIASEKISIYTDATDPELVDTVDPADVAKLTAWKKYRIALTKVTADNQKLPVQPE
jgi:hypothetical protein